jgi:hypothetical protein
MDECLSNISLKVPETLLNSLEELDVGDFFGLEEPYIKAELQKFEFLPKSNLSPQFHSPGFGVAEENPLICSSVFSPKRVDRDATLLHELKHGLHYLVCKNLYDCEEDATILSNYKVFREALLGDAPFLDFVGRKGTDKQKTWISELIDASPNPDPSEIREVAYILGALTYQHAYFVDPSLCEVAASYRDSGMLRALNTYNRVVGGSLPVAKNPYKGYSNKGIQQVFAEACPTKKALLVNSTEYDQKRFFSGE